MKLNKWQTLLLFTPFVAGSILLETIHRDPNSAQFREYFKIANFLSVLNVLILLSYQLNLIYSFHKAFLKKNTAYLYNAFIPLVLVVIYFSFVLYYSFIKENPGNAIAYSPVRKIPLTLQVIFIYTFFIHALITFFFLNTKFLSNRIKTLELSQQPLARMQFLYPNNWLIRSCFLVLFIALIVGVIIDFVKATSV